MLWEFWKINQNFHITYKFEEIGPFEDSSKFI